MSGPHNKKLASLASVVDLRERDKERLLADLATKRELAERYRKNLARLEQLCSGAGASAPLSGGQLSVMSQNRGDYKQAVMRMADGHRDELSLHEADMRVAQQALTRAVHKHEALDQVLSRRQETLQRSQARGEQKQQDELANQSWWRGQQ
jgi:flagellar export protein FliJ